MSCAVLGQKILSATEAARHYAFPAQAQLTTAVLAFVERAKLRGVHGVQCTVIPVHVAGKHLQAHQLMNDVFHFAGRNAHFHCHIADRNLAPALDDIQHLALARLPLAEQRVARNARSSAELAEFLGRLERAAERGGRVGTLIDVSLLEALAHGLRNESGAAFAALERALALAEPEGFLRVFVDLGPPMAELLGAAGKRGIAPAHVRELVAAFAPARTAVRPQGEEPVDPLSERELDVLRLLRSELDGPAIARELMVSLNTMRTHTKKIFEKLGVNNRRAAVRRAEELDLLQRRPR